MLYYILQYTTIYVKTARLCQNFNGYFRLASKADWDLVISSVLCLSHCVIRRLLLLLGRGRKGGGGEEKEKEKGKLGQLFWQQMTLSL